MSDTQLSKTIFEAMKVRSEMLTDGASQTEANAVLEEAVRKAWPTVREWKYLCSKCSDYGLEMRECPGDATCGRPNPHLPHEYGMPCTCSRGERYRPKSQASTDESLGKRKKPAKTFSRFQE